MVKWEHRYFIISNQSEIEELGYKFEVMPGKMSMCMGMQTMVYATNHDTLFISIETGGFNLHTGDIEQYNNEPLVKFEMFQKGHITTLTQGGATSVNVFIDSALNSDIKDAYLIHKINMYIRQHEISILQRVCENERLLLLNILQVARIDPSTAGFLLTGNRSNFLETDGALAWLYSCSKRRSPYKETITCYDHIPVWYGGKTEFISTVTRKLIDPILVLEVDCAVAKDFVYQFVMDDPTSWYKLLPFPASTKAPEQFQTKKLARQTKYHAFDWKKTGVYNEDDIKRFIARISTGEHQAGLLKQMVHNIGMSMEQHKQTGRSYWGEGKSRVMYVDYLISPNYRKQQFLGTFGKIPYYMQVIGSYFAFFTLCGCAFKLVTITIRFFEIKS